jgi:hypothetical protein
MTKCAIHNCELKQLFTSSYCAECDAAEQRNSRVLAKLDREVEAGWYHQPIVAETIALSACGIDANGSDVDDMDVCMGLKADMAPSNFALMAEMQERSREEQYVVPTRWKAPTRLLSATVPGVAPDPVASELCRVIKRDEWRQALWQEFLAGRDVVWIDAEPSIVEIRKLLVDSGVL